MFKKRDAIKACAVTIILLLITSCADKAQYPAKKIDFLCGGGAGGGWDTTIRSVANVLEKENIVDKPMPVTNKTGGGGGVGLAYLANQNSGNDYMITVFSPPLLLINLNGSTELGYKDTTPIANLIADYACFTVSKNSKYKSINDVMDALKKDIKSVKIVGTSSIGSMDHLQFLKIAKAAGVENVSEIDYVAAQDNAGGAMVLGGHADLFSSGIADARGLIESKDLIPLAVTSENRIGTGIMAEIPTCIESGINATFINWRGIFGPPGMSTDVQKYWEETLSKMIKTQAWKTICEKNGWNEMFMSQEEYIPFIEKTNEEYKVLLKELGMLGK